MKMTQYKYSFLESAEHIRLLKVGKLDPIDGDFNYKFEIADCLLEKAPPYETLSYTWGSPDLVGKVELANGEYIAVSRNLITALPYVAGNLNQDFLWVDQICIDQANIPERNQQVSLMKKIYRRSERVLVWLGEADKSTKYIVELIEGIGSQPDARHLCLEPGDAEKLDALAKNIKPFIDLSNNPNSVGVQRRSAIKNLLNRPWFQRVWVFQEVIVPKSVIMLVGNVLIHFRDLDNVVHSVWAVEYEGRGYRNSIAKMTIGFEPFAKMIHGRIDYASGKGFKDPLGHLSQVGSTFQATVLHDFIYAFAGLLEDSGVNITPDYALPVEHAFISATRALIESRKDLDVLAYVPGRNLTNSYPSWSPDWSKPQPVPMPVHDAVTGSSFQASGQFYYCKTDHESPSRLVVHGKIIDHITKISGHSFDDVYFMDDIRKLLNLAGHLTALNSGQAPEFVPITRERLLKATLMDGGSPAGKLHRGERLTPDFVADLLAAHDKWPQLNANDKTIENYDKLKDALYELQQHSLQTQHKRAIYTTNGRLGLAPQWAHVNDTICILHGSKTPIVLRQRSSGSSEWVVIGQCYCEDVMHGEGVTWEEDEADTFVLA